MLNTAVRNTRKLVRLKSKEEGLRIGNRFVKKETAACLAGFLLPRSGTVTILSPDGGTGIMAAAAVEELCRRGGTDEIYVTLYETNAEYLPILYTNMKRVRQKCRHDYGVKLRFTVVEEDFTAVYTPVARKLERFDLLLLPADETLPEKDDAALLSEKELFRVPVARSFLLLSAAMRALREGGQLIALLPTTFATAASLVRCRQRVFASLSLHRIHLFSIRAKKRETNGERNDVLRKTMILSLAAGQNFDAVTVSASYDEGESVRCLPPLSFDFLVRGEERRMILLQSEEELSLLRTVEALPESLSSLGLQMKTGLVLPSRYPELLSDVPTEGAIPLFSPAGIQGGHVVFPLPVKNQYIVPRLPSLRQKNKNMLLLKRVPSKSDGRHLTAAVYMASQFPRLSHISTHNKLMTVDLKDGSEMDAALLCGLYALFNSTLYEKYCSILSKSEQVNASDYRELPLPAADTVRRLGRTVMTARQFSAKACDVIVKNALAEKKE